MDVVEELDRQAVERHVEAALREDIETGDATTMATVPESLTTCASVVARQDLTLAGTLFAQTAFRALSSRTTLELCVKDGDRAQAGQVLIEIEGPTRALLTAERVALNYLQRLSGVATMTFKFVHAIAGTQARILDTRKTTPGWRRFEKYAVRCGGGVNHRLGLFDMILIKDNHLAALNGAEPNPIAAAVHRARMAFPDLKVEVEVDTLAQLEQALAAKAEWILLDNMAPDELRAAVRLCKGRAHTEASGGVTLETVRGIAETGVEFISVGALTHSAPAADIALDFRL